MIVYSADTAPTERLARFAHGADLFVCEAALGDASNDSSERGHMDAAEAGREAGARRRQAAAAHPHPATRSDTTSCCERRRVQRRYISRGSIDLAMPGSAIDV